ncbi:hypothetical protein ACGFIJ_30020 [Microbispora bryophytorum]|uniref:hypothetical protein n=1 Tax=Microbispora bryophytorum TaxID=1460882 RepID=UPI00371E8FF3
MSVAPIEHDPPLYRRRRAAGRSRLCASVADLQDLIKLARRINALSAQHGVAVDEARRLAEDELDTHPADQRKDTTMTTKINPKDLGHDGRCDHEENGSPNCDRQAVAAVLSATTPDMWAPRAAAAAIAFLCAGHLDAEPIAHLEHAERNAKAIRAEGAPSTTRDAWDALLANYPAPIPLSA